MKCLAILAAGALILVPAAVWAAPDDAPGKPVATTDVPESAVATTGSSISLSMTTMGSGADRKVRIEIGGDWDSLPETARRSVLDSLKTMLPEAALKTVLKRIVAGDRVIEVPAPETADLRAELVEEILEIEDEEIMEDPVIRDGGLVLRGMIAVPKSGSKGGGCGGGGCGGGEAEKPAGCKGDGSCGACTGEEKPAPKAFFGALPKGALIDRLLRINGREVQDRAAVIKLIKQGEAFELLDEDDDVLRRAMIAKPGVTLLRDGEIEVETDVRIIGPDGKPIAPGKGGVVIVRPGGKTDASGRFKIEGLAPGTHRVRVQSGGPKVYYSDGKVTLLGGAPGGCPQCGPKAQGRCGCGGRQAPKAQGRCGCGGQQAPKAQGRCGCGGRQAPKAQGRCGCGGQPAPKAQGRCGCGGQQAPKAQGRCGCGGQQAPKAQGRCGCGGQQAPKAQGRCGCGGRQAPKAQGRCGCGGRQAPKAQGRCGCGGQPAPKAQGRCSCGGKVPGQGPDAVIRAMEALRREMEALRREIRGAHGMHGGMKPPPGAAFGFGAAAPPKVAVPQARFRMAPGSAPKVAGKPAFGMTMPKSGGAGGAFIGRKPDASVALKAEFKKLQDQIAKQHVIMKKLLDRIAKLEAANTK